ncbi:hypothetical protein [Nocardioides sp. SYSU DS0651]|uniref:hypothetical protein n=1 Tax=Nocardioides sp. SYSU DS0651 TaxID=3415955 RepID=UPI003F4C912C
MTARSEEPIEQANEADVIEQEQSLDDPGTVTPRDDVSGGEANEADALEQRASVTGDDEDAYPHQAEQADE